MFECLQAALMTIVVYINNMYKILEYNLPISVQDTCLCVQGSPVWESPH
jgi:hypothetical protein